MIIIYFQIKIFNKTKLFFSSELMREPFYFENTVLKHI